MVEPVDFHNKGTFIAQVRFYCWVEVEKGENGVEA